MAKEQVLQNGSQPCPNSSLFCGWKRKISAIEPFDSAFQKKMISNWSWTSPTHCTHSPASRKTAGAKGMSTLEDWDVNHLGETHGITNMIHYIRCYPFNVYWVVYPHRLIHAYSYWTEMEFGKYTSHVCQNGRATRHQSWLYLVLLDPWVFNNIMFAHTHMVNQSGQLRMWKSLGSLFDVQP